MNNLPIKPLPGLVGPVFCKVGEAIYVSQATYDAMMSLQKEIAAQTPRSAAAQVEFDALVSKLEQAEVEIVRGPAPPL